MFGNNPAGGGGSFSGGAVTFPILFPDGTAGAPSIAFSSDPDTGFYWVSANSIGASAGGTLVASITPTAFNLVGVPIAAFVTSSTLSSGNFTNYYTGGASTLPVLYCDAFTGYTGSLFEVRFNGVSTLKVSHAKTTTITGAGTTTNPALAVNNSSNINTFAVQDAGTVSTVDSVRALRFCSIGGTYTRVSGAASGDAFYFGASGGVQTLFAADASLGANIPARIDGLTLGLNATTNGAITTGTGNFSIGKGLSVGASVASLDAGDGSIILAGGMWASAVTITTDLTATGANFTIFCDTTAAGITVTLPAAASNAGKLYNIKKVSVDINTVTIDPNGAELIDGAANVVFTTPQASYQIQCDGTGWKIIGLY